VTELIGKGIDPNFHDDDSGETPLTLAVMQDHVELITVLVEGGGYVCFLCKTALSL
jgi:SH3/ankyrin repeat-containing protein